MCKLRRKLLLFDYTIDKLVNWELELTRNSSLSVNECLIKFSGIRLMKCLYSISLETVRNQNSINDTLFPIYDNFIAYEYGPVEIDAYNNRSILLRYTYKDRRMYENKEYKPEFEYNYPRLDKDLFKENPSEALKQLIDGEDMHKYVEMVDRAVTALKGNKDFPFDNVDKLVSLTHLDLWRDACMTSERKLEVNNWTELQEEFKNFELKMTNY